MINVGIIGSGFIVPEFVKATQLVKGYHYRGIASPVLEQLQNLKEKYNIDYYSLNNEDVLTDPKVDVIYVAVPNGLHYQIAKRALECGKHVILEKPFVPSLKEAKELIALAKKKNLIIFDAVTLVHMPNFRQIKKLVKDVGDIKMVTLNFSQYSSRYDKFKKGIVLPAFDRKMAGGALMDLGIYNINWVTGIFGKPKKVEYFPNLHKKIDTSGVLVLDYGSFKANCIAAKDCRAPLNCCIQGDLGYIKSDEASSVISKIKFVNNKGEEKVFEMNKHPEEPHYDEYVEFKKLYSSKDLKKAQEFNDHTLMTIEVLEKGLKSGGISFTK